MTAATISKESSQTTDSMDSLFDRSRRYIEAFDALSYDALWFNNVTIEWADQKCIIGIFLPSPGHGAPCLWEIEKDENLGQITVCKQAELLPGNMTTITGKGQLLVLQKVYQHTRGMLESLMRNAKLPDATHPKYRNAVALLQEPSLLR